jgi:uncharacterized membrane protein YccF (DUF307 family)
MSSYAGLAAVGVVVVIPIFDMCLTGRRNRTDDQVSWDIVRNIIYLAVGGIFLAFLFVLTAILYYIASCFGENGASLFGLLGYWLCPFGRQVGPSQDVSAQVAAPKEQCCCFTCTIHCSLWGILSLPLFLFHMFYAMITNLICCRSSLAQGFSSFEQIVSHPFKRQVNLVGNVPPAQGGAPPNSNAPPQYGTA